MTTAAQQLALFQEPQPYHDDVKHGDPPRQVRVSVSGNGDSVASSPVAPLTLPVRPYAGKAPAVKHSVTSKAAAEAIEPKLAPLQAKVLLALDMFGPLSDEALDRVCHVVKTLRPRRVELTKEPKKPTDPPQYVHDSGLQMKGSSDLMVTIWELTLAGERKATEIKDASVWAEASEPSPAKDGKKGQEQ